MKKILVSMMTIAMVSALIGGGIYAAFSDQDSGTGNQFVAGTLDLKLSDGNETDQDAITASLSSTNLGGGETIGPATITLKNVGSINGSTLDIDISYSENDGTAPANFEFTTNVSADDFADELIVDTLTYGGVDLLAGVTDVDADGKDLKEVAAADLTGQAGINGSSATKDLVIQITFKDVGNDYQNDGIDVTFSFTLNQ